MSDAQKAAKREELIKALAALGVTDISEDQDEKALKKLLADAQKAANKGAIKVLDSNGKLFREVETQEEAEQLAKHIGGRIAK